jgi:hypothetical protein
MTTVDFFGLLNALPPIAGAGLSEGRVHHERAVVDIFRRGPSTWSSLYPGARILQDAESTLAQGMLGMVETALEEFEPADRPILEVDSRLRCSGIDQEAQDETGYCSVAFGEARFRRWSSALGAKLVDPSAPSPRCSAQGGEAGENEGLRMTLEVQGDTDEVVWVNIVLTCELAPNPTGTGLLHAHRYPFRLGEGGWRTSGEVESVRITP